MGDQYDPGLQEYNTTDGMDSKGDDPADLLQYINKDQTTGLHICSICSNFSHKSRSNVRNHIESKHFAGSFIYTCSICEKTCASHQSLLKHKSVFHKFDSA